MTDSVVRLGEIFDQFRFDILRVFRPFSEMCIVLSLVFLFIKNILRSVKRRKTIDISLKNLL